MNNDMNHAIEKLQAAQMRAMQNRPKVGGFPYLAEVLRAAGVRSNVWFLPSCQSLYLTEHGDVVQQGKPLVDGICSVPAFDRDRLIAALRTDQQGLSTFPEFLESSWKAGVVRYDVDFIGRNVTYMGCRGESYVEMYPKVSV